MSIAGADGTKRRHLLRLIGGAGAAAACLAGPTVRTAAAQGKRVLKIAHFDQTTNSLHKGFERFKELAEQRSGGELDIRVFPASQLGNIRDVVEGLRVGTIEITSTGPDYTSNLVPLMITASLYYLWRSPEHVTKTLEGPVGARLSEALAAGAGLRILTWGHQGFRSTLSKRPVTAPADLKGMKIRVPEAKLHVRPFQLLGANPTPVPYAEVYTALQTNVVEACEGSPAAMIQMKFFEVAKNFALTTHLFNPYQILISERVYATLSPKLQQVVTESMGEAMALQRKLSAEENAEAIGQLKAGGVRVVDVDVAAFRSIVQPVWKELAESAGPEAVRIVEQIAAVQA